MKKFLKRKVGGFIVTFELIFSVVLWTAMLDATLYIVNAQMIQKQMYNAFTQTVMLVSKWGGTNSNLWNINGKTCDISSSVQKSLREITGQNVTITATPDKVEEWDTDVRVQLKWTDNGYRRWGGASKEHKLDVTFPSIVKPGLLL